MTMLRLLAGAITLLALTFTAGSATAETLCFDGFSVAVACEGYPYEHYYAGVALGGYTTNPAEPCVPSHPDGWFRLSESSTDPGIDTGTPGANPSELFLWFMGYHEPHWHWGGTQLYFAGGLDIASVEPIGAWQPSYIDGMRFLDLTGTDPSCSIDSPSAIARLIMSSVVHVDESNWGSIKALYR